MEVFRGDIFYITSLNDEVGSEQHAGRPAVIVSNEKNNQFGENVTIVYLTSKEKKPLPTHTFVTTTRVASTALCESITTINKSRLGDFLCQATEDEMRRIDECIKIALNLTGNDELVVSREETPGIKETDIDYVKLQTERDIYKELYFKVAGLN